ncbi:MAG: putative unusual protein kinase [Candidatus Atelocyanobacterium thalassa isolate SIO64986]|uniref:Putative unusual protein kinase n=1 Tax=Candidatus Atelocyanobacterium thalassa isolate SIO64986 TaxID=1527444 RepID=A0A086CIP6_9CHRO|nr:MAG: putative unusual protein kinase [Candidatus Atelocyanobacterium thalassa isolate SIO64986]
MPHSILFLENLNFNTANININSNHPFKKNTENVDNYIENNYQYSPNEINKYYRKHIFKVANRLIRIFSCFSSFIFKLWWSRLIGKNIKEDANQAIHLRKILTELGPTYIKIGQALSTRPDLVPPVYLNELTLLQDKLPSFPNEIAYRFIQEELGCSAQSIYKELSENPIAAASLGQVYKGKLKTGEQVAIKVQRPGLLECITLDIYILRYISHWLQNNFSFIHSDLVAITDELAERIFEEIDYVKEGNNAEEFAKHYSHLPEIYVPKIYWEYTARRVLTMEWIEGTKLTNIEKIQAQGIEATHLVEIGVHCSLCQLLEYGLFHADPHPGNLLAMKDGKLAYLDFGMMSRIESYQRYGFIEAVIHLVNRDFDALAYDYVKLGFLEPETDLTPITVALKEIFNNALGSSVAELNFKNITDQMSSIMYEFPFKVPAYYALILRSMVTLEGIAIGIDPNFKVLSKAYSYVAKRLLTDPSPELRRSLTDLLFKKGNLRWNRLESLMINAQNFQSYDIDIVFDQIADFIFSPEGEFIREQLINEVIDSVDIFGRQIWFKLSITIRKQIGLTRENSIREPTEDNSLKHLKNILIILNDLPGFEPMHLSSLLIKLIGKRETQQMGVKILDGLAHKMMARLVRNLLLEINQSK